jgi:pimeloyl-ACP methyl ester carboxylesterase
MTYASRIFFRAGPERLARALGPAVFCRIFGVPKTKDGPRTAALRYELHAARERQDGARAFDALYPTLGPVPSRLSRLSEITAPALVLWGDHDEVFPSPIAIAAAAALPRAELRIEPVGHAPHLEATERVLPAIAAFLDARGT